MDPGLERWSYPFHSLQTIAVRFCEEDSKFGALCVGGGAGGRNTGDWGYELLRAIRKAETYRCTPR